MHQTDEQRECERLRRENAELQAQLASVRLQLEGALEDSEIRFRMYMDNCPAIAFMKDADGRLLYINRAFEQTFGFDKIDWRGKTDFELWPADVASVLRDNDKAILEGDKPVHVEEEVTHPDGRHCWMSFKFPLVDHAGAHFLGGMAIDVTEQKRAEHERVRLREKLLEIQKLESLDVLAGGIAHDFNNLLVAILGNASYARETLPPGSALNDILGEIETAGRRASELANQMLAYSGRGKFVVEPVDLSELVGGMAELLRTSVEKTATFTIDRGVELPAVEADATQLRQVVMNLITNASDALGGDAGVVRVSTGVIDVGSGTIKAAGRTDTVPSGRYVSLEVRDSGCGMSSDTMARMFEPFFTTKFTGRGLGLAGVLGIVRGHHGFITVETTPGLGTTVRILLPPAERPVRAVEPSRSTPRRAGSGTVLVVDDEEDVRRVVERMLRAEGYDVMTVASGEEARALVEQNPTPRAELRCVLLDLTMRRLSGARLLPILRESWPHLPVVLMSGYSEEEVRAQTSDDAGVLFLEKPFMPAQLLDRIAAAIEKAAIRERSSKNGPDIPKERQVEAPIRR